MCPDNFDGIVYDVGGGMFDHHTEPRETRPNGVPYAAFGLLWRVLGAGLVGEHQARLLDENFIQPLDLNDNTGEPNSLADAIGSFNPVWDSKDDPDQCFWRAVPFAQTVLENEIAAANAVNRADAAVQRAYKNARDGIVVLPRLYALEKRPVQDRRAVCGVSQPAGRVQRPVRYRLPHPPQQGALPRGVGRQAGGGAAPGVRAGAAVLPSQPVFDHCRRPGPGRWKPAAAPCAPPESR